MHAGATALTPALSRRLSEMGLVAAFTTNAKPGATRRIFGTNPDLAGLPKGEAWLKLRGDLARRINVWR
jgi:LDH2 family malate/lactate/ureidoglycolate dehydrogenase